MKNRIKKITGAILLKAVSVMIAVSSITSCNYLSIQDYIDNDLAMDTIFVNARNLEAFMWAVTTYLPDEGDIWRNNHTPGPTATDEGISLFATSDHYGTAFITGLYNADNLGGLDNYQTWYRVVRQCNIILSRMDECRDCLRADKERILGYTLFFRAYAYYLLVGNYGPVLLLGDDVINNNEDVAYYNRPRNLYDECIEYICTQFEEAAQYLPLKLPSIMDFGLPTRGAAYGLVARLRLWHASDLYNGGSSAHLYFGTWTRKTDGAHYIQQTPDPRRWAVAAAAAKRVMDMNEFGVPLYKLHTIPANDRTFRDRPLSLNTSDPNYTKDWPNGAAGIDPYYSYSNMFNNESVPSVNPEFIWARNSSGLTYYTRYSLPYANGGWNGNAVPQKIVDAYEMADGRNINTSSAEYPYTEEGFTGNVTWVNGYYRIQPQVSNMYVNREVRFYASIGFSGCYWDLLSAPSEAGQTVWYYVDGPNGKYASSNPIDHPATGYVLRKYVNPIDAYRGTGARLMSKSFPMIRYAEILMAYAEALNELVGNEYTIDDVTYRRDFTEIKDAYNQVRYRAGLPGITDADLANEATFREKIKRERMVEFFQENHRYFDVRRWGDYERSESVSITGMNMEGTGSSFYQRVVPPYSVIAQRVVDRKMIFLPIPKNELRRVPSFDQNPGW